MKLRKEIKHCQIGDVSFDIGVNRDLCAQAFEKYPALWDLAKDAKENQNNISKMGAKEQFELTNRYYEAIDNVAIYMFPKMLEFAESSLYDCKTYDELAESIIEYCDENDVLNTFIDEAGNPQKGLLENLFEYVCEGFTRGRIQKKAKVAVKM